MQTYNRYQTACSNTVPLGRKIINKTEEQVNNPNVEEAQYNRTQDHPAKTKPPQFVPQNIKPEIQFDGNLATPNQIVPPPHQQDPINVKINVQPKQANVNPPQPQQQNPLNDQIIHFIFGHLFDQEEEEMALTRATVDTW